MSKRIENSMQISPDVSPVIALDIKADKQREYNRVYNLKWQKLWREKNPVACKRKAREFRLKKYGISIEKYNELFKQQNGVCLGCNRHQSELKRTLSVDHCHKSMQIRGLLCTRCNLALGQVNDKPEVLRQLADYIEAHNG